MRPLIAIAALAIAAAPAALGVGAVAPDFATRGAIAGKVVPVRLADSLKKGPVVLYFFPAAFTGGCNAEAHAFAEAIPDFAAAGATVIGLSMDRIDTLAKFSTEKCVGKFTVASAGPRLVAKYGVGYPEQIKGPDGAMRSITRRVSYVIAPNGRVLFVHDAMSPADHVRLTLDAARKWKAGDKR